MGGECEKHGPFGPNRFCIACNREPLEAERDRLREALIPFAFLGNVTAHRLGLHDEWKLARDLLGLRDE